jgi:DNA-binding PadR family transcriptional regulator
MGKKTDRQELLPGTLDMLVRKTLSIGVMHGYGIAQHIRMVSGEVLHVEEGSPYPAVQRLQIQGLAHSESGHTANHRRPRHLPPTRAGRRALGEAESSFDRLIGAIRRVMKPA